MKSFFAIAFTVVRIAIPAFAQQPLPAKERLRVQGLESPSQRRGQGPGCGRDNRTFAVVSSRDYSRP